MLKGKRSVTPSRGNPSNADNNKNNNKKLSAPPIMSQQSNQQLPQSQQQQPENTIHWNEIVQETVLSATNPEKLYFNLTGGADDGQFPHIGEIHSNPVFFDYTTDFQNNITNCTSMLSLLVPCLGAVHFRHQCFLERERGLSTLD